VYYVYLLELSNKTLYVGYSTNLSERIKSHQNGQVLHTSKFRPIKLVYYSAFLNQEKALLFEKYLKGSSGKAFRNKHLL